MGNINDTTSECTQICKPLISIVMAVYEPRIDWLQEQLLSLEQQTYPNLELIIRDDCSPTVVSEIICMIVQSIITFPVIVERNETNCGCNKTFELLTAMANGEYIAYCDQDDIWYPEKIERLWQAIQGCTLSYCDMSVIDADGLELASSLCDIRPRLNYYNGEGLYKKYLFTNCTAGCSMLVAANAAKRAIPFPEGTVWDQWVCSVASFHGAVAFLSEPLVRYRQHENNQTGIFKNIQSKLDYKKKRIYAAQRRMQEFERRFGLPEEMLAFMKARVEQNIFAMWKYRKLSKREAYFEISMRFMPEHVFCIIVNYLRGKSHENIGDRRHRSIRL